MAIHSVVYERTWWMLFQKRLIDCCLTPNLAVCQLYRSANKCYVLNSSSKKWLQIKRVFQKRVVFISTCPRHKYSWYIAHNIYQQLWWWFENCRTNHWYYLLKWYIQSGHCIEKMIRRSDNVTMIRWVFCLDEYM